MVPNDSDEKFPFPLDDAVDHLKAFLGEVVDDDALPIIVNCSLE
jgi:hypothetical protein